MWYLVYLVARALARLLVSARQPRPDDGAKDLEILVLRHQLRVLQRTAGRPKLRVIDRILLAAASRVTAPRRRRTKKYRSENSMEFLPVEESACYRAIDPESGKLNPSGTGNS